MRKTLNREKANRTLLLFALTAVLIGIISIPANAGEIIFKDNFDEGNTQKWKPLHGRWIGLTDTEVYRQAMGGKERLGQSFIQNLTVTNFTMTLKIRFLGGAAAKGSGGALRLRSNLDKKGKENQVYIVGLGPATIGGLRITKKLTVNGKAHQKDLLSNVYPPVKIEQWYDFKVRMSGAKITVWVDGEQVAEVEDKNNPMLSGAVGVSTYGAAIEVDDITIEEE